MKLTINFIAIFFLLFSCGSNLELEGEFVKVLKSDKENNIYTFDFNETLKLSDNVDNYLVTDKNANKSIATIEKGIISYNNCQIIIDKKENVLTNICTIDNQSYSNDYWSKEKVERYLTNLEDVNFREYIDKNYLSKLDEFYGIPRFDDLTDEDKTHIDKATLETNPSYPFISFGDFNKDGRYPDVAVIGAYKFSYLYDVDYSSQKPLSSLFILHADTDEIIEYNFPNIYPFIEDQKSVKIKDKNNIMILNLKEWNGWDVTWNGQKYKNTYVNLH